MSEVRIDEAALTAEADAIANSMPPPPLEAGAEVVVQQGPPAADVIAGYKMIAGAVVSRGFDTLAPAWQVTQKETDNIADATAQALFLWFPDQIVPPKYMALLVLAGSFFEVIDSRRDPATGNLKPRFYAKPTTNNASASSPSVAS
jgi:hypothetical protein